MITKQIYQLVTPQAASSTNYSSPPSIFCCERGMPTGSPVTYSPFFKSVKHPRDWSFPEYLKYPHSATLSPRRILDSWSKSLIYITKCSDKEFSHAHRKRAVELLKRYKEKVGTCAPADHLGGTRPLARDEY